MGGVAGRLIQGSITTQMLTGVTVTAPHASKVGGLVGSLESPSTSTESGYEVGSNAVKVTVSAGTGEAEGTVTSVGGLVGNMANGRYIEQNTVEADVRQPMPPRWAVLSEPGRKEPLPTAVYPDV